MPSFSRRDADGTQHVGHVSTCAMFCTAVQCKLLYSVSHICFVFPPWGTALKHHKPQPSRYTLTRWLASAGQQSDDCSLHVADAVAVDSLLKALSTQTQLESVEIAFRGAILPDWEKDIASDMDSDEEAMIQAEAEEEIETYRRLSAITSQMFHSAWTSVCTLLEDSRMFRLRYTAAWRCIAPLRIQERDWQLSSMSLCLDMPWAG